MGHWRGLAIDAQGGLWHAGKWSAGLISWDPSPLNWWQRQGAAFEYAFGDPYYPDGSGIPPVFRVANEGHVVALTAVAVCPDGKVWFGSSGPRTACRRRSPRSTERASHYFNAQAMGLGEAAVRDLACLPDGRLVLAGFSTGLALYDPATGTSKQIHAGGGLPSDRITAARGGPDGVPADLARLDRSGGGSAAGPPIRRQVAGRVRPGRAQPARSGRAHFASRTVPRPVLEPAGASAGCWMPATAASAPARRAASASTSYCWQPTTARRWRRSRRWGCR